MKVVILAGGRGTRLSEETDMIPKPMVEIGGQPILWHIMKTYSYYGFNDFVVCLGYKGYIIKKYFADYSLHMHDMTIDIGSNKTKFHAAASEPWKITLIDTGLEAQTGARLKRIQRYVGNKTFMMTYGDGVGDIDIKALLDFHRKKKPAVTVTAVHPLGRFGSLDVGPGDKVRSFMEKPKGENSWISAGYFVLEPEIFKYIKGDVLWEKAPLENLAKDGKLAAYKHTGVWRPMDTLRDKNELERLWQTGRAPWKVWK